MLTGIKNFILDISKSFLKPNNLKIRHYLRHKTLLKTIFLPAKVYIGFLRKKLHVFNFNMAQILWLELMRDVEYYRGGHMDSGKVYRGADSML